MCRGRLSCVKIAQDVSDAAKIRARQCDSVSCLFDIVSNQDQFVAVSHLSRLAGFVYRSFLAYCGISYVPWVLFINAILDLGNTVAKKEKAMANNTPTPRQPKLRSSCDACGAAKLRCDRDQPECSRCVSYGITCHYGVSRKMGKPRRDRNQNPPSSTAEKPTLTSTEVELTFPEVPGSWDTLDDGIRSHDNLTDRVDEFDQPFPSLLPPSSSLDLSSPYGLQVGTALSTPGYSPNLTNYCLTPLVSNNLEPHQNSNLASANCARDLNTTLESLSMIGLPKTHYDESPSPSVSSTEITIGTGAPFDHGLCVTRQVIERLSSHLLTCPCSAGPSLALLYASGISRVLAWYQQAACAQSGSAANGLPRSECGGGGLTPASLTSTDGFSAMPATMAVGTFSVDDFRVQSALRMQLLLGEMRRAGGLIELFVNSHITDTGQKCQDESVAAERLHQSLDTWLRNEHSRIANMMRGRLRELNMLD